MLVYLAPKLLGPGRAMATLPVLPSLTLAFEMRFEAIRPLGHDLCLLARRVGADSFLPCSIGVAG